MIVTQVSSMKLAVFSLTSRRDSCWSVHYLQAVRQSITIEPVDQLRYLQKIYKNSAEINWKKLKIYENKIFDFFFEIYKIWKQEPQLRACLAKDSILAKSKWTARIPR